MRRFFFILIIALPLYLLCSANAMAQVRFDINGGGWGYGPGVTISVGDRGYCPPYTRYPRRPVYRRRYPVYNTGSYCPPTNNSYWCNNHNQYYTHGNYYQGHNNTAYWCRPHQEYCTHR